MGLLRALDSRKRWEERERRRNELKLDRDASKKERRRAELELAKELRRACEDLEIKGKISSKIQTYMQKMTTDVACLSDLEDLPELKRIPCLRLPGAAFGNIMLVFEFLHQFGETLGFGEQTSFLKDITAHEK